MEIIVTKIGELITWYQNNCSKADPEQLLSCKDKLVTLNYNLAVSVADSSRDYHANYYIRRLTIARKKNSYIKSGEAVSKAESLATEEAAEQFQNELESEALAMKLDFQHGFLK